MAYCPQCGGALNPGASFCGACGATVPVAPATPPQPGAIPAAPAPTLAAGAGARPTGVTIIGVVTIAVSALAVAGALLAALFFGALGAVFVEAFPAWGGAFGGAMSALALLFAILLIAMAAVGIAAGLGVLRGRGWAWGLMIALMALNGLRGVIAMSRRDFGGIVTILISALVIWYFFQPDVKRWFGRA